MFKIYAEYMLAAEKAQNMFKKDKYIYEIKCMNSPGGGGTASRPAKK